tara:strand:+ start:2467 stop:3942 length:1476 start_codon:yes stop_codon:yes gene_type:complete
MKNRYLLIIDQGTTSTRTILYDDKFNPIIQEQIEIKQIFPKEGWVEHNPEEIWKSVKKTINKAIIRSKISPKNIVSIGITNQRETTVIWNKHNGKPIYNAIVWQDRRTSKYCNSIKKNKLIKTIQKITGLIIDPYFSATKIKWILENVKDSKNLLKENKLAFGTIDTWILWKLTKGKSHLTDITNASRTMIFDINKKDWSPKLLKFFNIPRKILPNVKENCHNFGTTKIQGVSINIFGIAGDQQAALIGQTCFNKGMSKSTYGTGCFLLMNIGKMPKLSNNRLLTSIAYSINGNTYYCLEGSIFTAGSAIQWLRDGIKIIKSASETDKIYKKSSKDQKIFMVPAFTGLGAPYWKPDIRGSIFGINRNTGIADIIKATIQSICFQTKDLVKLMEKDSLIKISEIRIDGGMIKNQSFIHFLCNILNIKIVVPKYLETTALGAAYLSAIGCGMINFKNIENKWKKNKIIYPKMNNNERNDLYSNWKKSVKKTLS